MGLQMISPQFAVPQVVEAAEYYRDVLGFTILGYFSQPPVYSIVRRDAVEIHLAKAATGKAAPNITRREGRLDAYIWVTELDPLYEEVKSRGAKVVEGPLKTVYQCYEMVVEDKFGFRLAFGMDISKAPESRKV